MATRERMDSISNYDEFWASTAATEPAASTLGTFLTPPAAATPAGVPSPRLQPLANPLGLLSSPPSIPLVSSDMMPKELGPSHTNQSVVVESPLSRPMPEPVVMGGISLELPASAFRVGAGANIFDMFGAGTLVDAAMDNGRPAGPATSSGFDTEHESRPRLNSVGSGLIFAQDGSEDPALSPLNRDQRNGFGTVLGALGELPAAAVGKRRRLEASPDPGAATQYSPVISTDPDEEYMPPPSPVMQRSKPAPKPVGRAKKKGPTGKRKGRKPTAANRAVATTHAAAADLKRRRNTAPPIIKNKTANIGTLTPEQRKVRIQRFLEKRSRRVWKKKINYRCRQKLADGRLRVKGRFVSQAEMERMGITRKPTGNASSLAAIGGGSPGGRNAAPRKRAPRTVAPPRPPPVHQDLRPVKSEPTSQPSSQPPRAGSAGQTESPAPDIKAATSPVMVPLLAPPPPLVFP